MNEIVNFISKNWSSLIPICLSVIALLVSIRTQLNLRPSLDVSFEDDLFITNKVWSPVQIFENVDGFLGVYLKVVNPSPMDIAFFDLVVMDTENPSQNFQIFTQKVLDGAQTKQYRFIDKNGEANLNAPESNYGIFLAHSYSRYEIIFDSNQNLPERITIRFKVSVKSKKTVPNSVYRRKFKYYEAVYNTKTLKKQI